MGYQFTNDYNKLICFRALFNTIMAMLAAGNKMEKYTPD